MSALVSMSPRKHRLSVDDFHRMGEVGILDPNVRCELIDGEIIDVARSKVDPVGWTGIETC